MEKKKLVWIAIAVAAAIIISFITPPEGLGLASMRFMGVFVAMIIILVAQALPDWVVALFVLGAAILFHIDKISAVLAPLGQPIIWLVFGVLALAVGIGNSGLMRRIAYKILTLFPTSYKGTVLSMITTSAVLSPLISSSLAKASILAPVATSITEGCGLKERSRGALGIFIASFIPAYYFGNVFISGSANVGVMMGLMKGVTLDYLGWMTAASIFGITMLVGTYIFCMTYCKPKAGEMGDLSPEIVKQRLVDLGPMGFKEKYALVIIVLALTAWIFASKIGVDAGTVAIIAVALLAAVGLFTKEDLAKVPWTLILFIGMLLSIASAMSSLGVSAWLSKILGPVLSPMMGSPWVFIPLLCILVFLMRFVIVSNLANIAILLAIFGPLMEPAGMSMFVLIFVAFNCGSMWNVAYQNPLPLAALAAGGGKYVTFNEFRYGSYAYMIMCVVAMMASIPLWKAMGFIW